MKHLIFINPLLWPAFIILTFLIPFSSATSAEFSIDGREAITIGKKQFSTPDEYVNSDYFHKNNMKCGVMHMDVHRNDKAEKAFTDCTNTITRIKNEYWPTKTVFTIPVWWHVIYRSDGVGNIPEAAIKGQMQALNEDFQALAGTIGSRGHSMSIKFTLAGITRTQSNTWFVDSPYTSLDYKQQLGKDPKRFLNIYTNDAQGYLGYAYFPQGSAGEIWDGIVLFYRAVGGRNNNFSPYNQGRTLVHEMGHYLGLAHTFDKSTCSNTYSTGDLIRDTPAESIIHFQCIQSYSCGTPDPIHNYMSYTNDGCTYQFTREQANRAVCGLINYRPDLFSGSAVTPFLNTLLLK